MFRSHKSLPDRIAPLVGSYRPHEAVCFHCGKTTTLGRLRVALKGEMKTSCLRAACAQALQRLVLAELEAFALGDHDA